MRLDYINSLIGKIFKDGGRGPDSFDCWGLVCDIYENCLGIMLPTYEFIAAADQRNASKAALQYREEWEEIPGSKEQPGDVVLFRPCHVGVVVDRGRMVHIDEGLPACIESYRSAIWLPKLIGFYRHA